MGRTFRRDDRFKKDRRDRNFKKSKKFKEFQQGGYQPPKPESGVGLDALPESVEGNDDI